MSTGSDPDHDRPSVGPDLGTNSMQILSVDVKSCTNQGIS